MKDGNKRLISAVKNGDTAVINTLIANGVDVNERDDQGQTALYISAIHGYGKFGHEHAEVAKMLITAGANVNIKDNAGYTPLHYAAMNGCTNVVKALLAAKADVLAKDNDGHTALQLAALSEHDIKIKRVLKRALRTALRLSRPGKRAMVAAIGYYDVLANRKFSGDWEAVAAYYKSLEGTQRDDGSEAVATKYFCDECGITAAPQHQGHECDLCFSGCFMIPKVEFLSPAKAADSHN